MRPILSLALVALLLPVVGQAQQTIRFTPEATLACMKKARGKEAKEACIGEAAKACFNRIQPHTNGDVAACMAEETGYWIKRMDRAYDEMMVKAAAADEAFQKNPKSKKVPFKLTEDLEVMQTRRASWREARCAVEAMMRRGTPFTSTAAAQCTMELTGEQALFLEAAVRY